MSCLSIYDTCRMVENLESISTQIDLPDGGEFRVNRTTYSMVVTEPSPDEIPSDGFSVDFDDNNAESFQLPKSLFTNGTTRISASRITTIELFRGRDELKVVASNIVSLTLNGRTVVGLEEDIVITITKRTRVSYSAFYLYVWNFEFSIILCVGRTHSIYV